MNTAQLAEAMISTGVKFKFNGSQIVADLDTPIFAEKMKGNAGTSAGQLFILSKLAERWEGRVAMVSQSGSGYLVRITFATEGHRSMFKAEMAVLGNLLYRVKPEGSDQYRIS